MNTACLRGSSRSGVRSTSCSPSTRTRCALAIICLVYLAIALSYSFMTPAGEANDEFDHLAYTEYIVREHALPHIAVANGDESHQPPLYYLLTAGWQELLHIPPFTPTFAPGAPFVPGHMFHLAYSHRYDAEQRTDAIRVHWLRLFSVFCGLATVLLTYKAGRLSIGNVQVSLAAAAFVAVLPKEDVISSVLTNDALVTTLCAASMVAMLAYLRAHGQRARAALAFATGGLLGLAAITKFTSLPLAVLLLLILALCSYRAREWLPLPAAVVAFFLTAGWWFVRNESLYGSPLAQKAANSYLSKLVPGLVAPVGWLNSRRFLHFLPKSLFTTIWYDGGWNQFTLPFWMNVVLGILAGLSLIAALTYLIQRTKASGFSFFWPALVLVVGALAGLIAAYLIAKDTLQGEGRVTYAGLAPFAILCVTGASVGLLAVPGRPWSVRRWMQPLMIWAWPALLLCVNGYVIGDVLIRFAAL